MSSTTYSVEARVAHLLSQMTVEEKVAQLWGVWVTSLIDADRRFVPEKARGQMANGIGQISRVGAASLLHPPQSAALANDIQRYLVPQIAGCEG